MPVVKDELADELGHIMTEDPEHSPGLEISEQDLEAFEQLFGNGEEVHPSLAEVVWVVGALGHERPLGYN